MHFTIITPSLNQIDNLKRAIASIADQLNANINPQAAELRVHHHIQDGGSTDGTVDWLTQYEAAIQGQPSNINPEINYWAESLPSGYSFSFNSQPDTGMYDALNKGFGRCADNRTKYEETYSARTSNHVYAWLNCDEQYLSGTLLKAANYFKEHPQADMFWGDMLLVDESGELLAFRKSYPARWSYIATSLLYNFSCTLFFRNTVWDSLNGFDVKWKTVADADLILRALQAGFKPAILRDYLSAFTFDGKNLSETPTAQKEQTELKKSVPLWIRCTAPLLNTARLTEKLLYGAYRQTFPLEYELYTSSGKNRTRFTARHATQRWPRS